MNEIELRGCRFEPLMNYFKALGVLRVLSSQGDASTRGFWRTNHFVLITELDEEALIHFFLDEYTPTPVFSPWNRGSGFYPRGKETEAVRIIRRLRDCEDERLRSFGNAIRIIEDAIKKVTGKKPEDIDDKTIEESKDDLMAYCRNVLPDELLEWIDAVYAVGLDNRLNYRPVFAIVLGSGGNDGNLEFSINYLKSVCHVFDTMRENIRKANGMLERSLFDIGDEPTARKAAIGFFHPGGVGGPNATEGFEGGFLSNPWDFILMVEGVLLLAGSVSRRLGRESTSSVASFPFSVSTVMGGAEVMSAAEGAGSSSRGELWLPLWGKPMSLNELKRLFSEGRARLGRRTARNGLDFARSVATLGISRGISGFVRFGIYKRSGKSYLAVPLTVMPVREEKLKGADLLSDIDYWLDRIRDLTSDKDIPMRARELPRRVYDSMFGYLVRGDKRYFQRLIVSLGRAEIVISDLRDKVAKTSPQDSQARKATRRIPPLNLKKAWAEYANDDTPEFRIAYALAGIGWTGADLHPNRMDLDNIRITRQDDGNHRAFWRDGTGNTLPRLRDPVAFLASIFESRCQTGKKEKKELVPIGSISSVPLDDVQEFLCGSLDYRRLVDLFLGLILINDPTPLKLQGHETQKKREWAYGLSRDYVLLKSCFLPDPLLLDGERVTVPYDLMTGNLLKARRISDACAHAARKLRARRIVTVASFGKEGIDPLLLYASLLIPVDVREFSFRALPLIREKAFVGSR